MNEFRRSCDQCGKEIIITNNLYYQVNISIINPFGDNIWRGKTSDSHAVFCKDCGETPVFELHDKLQEAMRIHKKK